MTAQTTHPVLQWTLNTACVRQLTDAGVVRVQGDDARTWLNGQTTSDVRPATREASVYTLSVSVKGRIQADLWVVEEEDGLAFVAPRAAIEGLLLAMDRYIIMEDVELQPAAELSVLTVQGPQAMAVADSVPGVRRYSTRRLGAGGVDLWVPQAEAADALERLGAAARELGGGVASDSDWAAAHVAAGRPRFGADFGEDTYPQEAGLKERAVSFEKGCYLGQEVVCMLENRGQLARRLMVLQGPSGGVLQAGDVCITPEGAKVGQVTSFAPLAPPRALAYLKRGYNEPGTTVTVGSDTWTVTEAASASD